MRNPQQTIILATGFAMFSMFFGAGNIVFPLAMGQHTESMIPFAFMGLLITAVGVPFMGLIAMTLYDGDYKEFFARLGIWPGFVLSAIIMGLIGPFGAIPRCITLAYSTAHMYFPGISLPVFSIISCCAIFSLTYKKNKLLDILGYVLTPFLLLTLTIIIVKGLLESQHMPQSTFSPLPVFFYGFNEGYKTMDLLGAFFFSSVVIAGLKNDLNATSSKQDSSALIKVAIKASVLGAILLAIVYAGFSAIAAYNGSLLEPLPKDEMIGVLSRNILGQYAGFIATVCVALATLTTAMALSSVFAEFLHKDVALGKIGYIPSLLVTLVIAFFVSTLHFTGIAQFLEPILQVCYPSMIVLSAANLCYKLFGFKPVKSLVFGTLALTIAIYGAVLYLG
ncbi:MAG: branched-chain amino acid transport system II carrier protein [Parachlamydiales bacterium]|jgi:LIVCS family branched-chain amino acid:cation transporter